MKNFALIGTPENYHKLGTVQAKIKYIPDFILKLGVAHIPPVKMPHLAGVSFFPLDKKEGSVALELRGQLLCCPITIETLLRLPLANSLQVIFNCIKYAKKNGATIVGLSPWLSFLTMDGSLIAGKIEITITSGQRFRIFSALEGLKYIVNKLKMDWNSANIVIWGIDNYIGQISAHLLARLGKYLTLIKTREGNYEELIARIIYETGAAVKITKSSKNNLKLADILLVTSPIRGDFEPHLLKKGVVVYDMTLKEFSDVGRIRRDIFYINGALFNVPGDPPLRWDDGISEGYALDYMMEPLLLALENNKALDISTEINVKEIEKIGKKSEKNGFYLKGLYSYNSAGKIAQITDFNKGLAQCN